eukprot:comp20167_c0_seq1/m.39847 comp20167_c0_seq1/g.39847  ORF comp20167_c0_seq1/g.39847 comp20167_c0_seq1/m.39847 type:complete len:593 (-) comp20167_c0_seq1:164-1942(-)
MSSKSSLPLNVIGAIRDYVVKIASETGSGMKVLLLDSETVGIISMVISQKEIIDRGVYLVQRLDVEDKETMKHVTAMCLLRPTPDNIERLRTELKNPRFKEYHLFFTNILKTTAIEQLASSDELEVVKSVQEYFADYYAINRDLYSFNILHLAGMYGAEGLQLKNRIVDGLTSVLLSLKRKPVIRYLEKSDMCKDIANELSVRMSTENALFDWRRPDVPPLLLILDRREDPITPLLTQWTFQAMVHEELGLTNNRVVMRGRQNIPKDMEEIPLSSEQDEFYRDNMYETFDVFAANIKDKVDAFAARKKNVGKVNTIQDMQAFLEQYPDFKKEEIHVMKHFTIIPELSKLVGEHELLKCSEIEQILSCEDSHSTVVKEIRALIENPRVRVQNKLRLVLLYAFRYEKTATNSTNAFIELLQMDPNFTDEMRHTVTNMLRYAGQDVRQEDIFLNKTYASTAKRFLKQGFIPQQIDNIYVRHTPHVVNIIEQAVSGKLKPTVYPFQDGASLSGRPQDVIVFIVGGATYAEAKAIAALNAQSAAGAAKGQAGYRVLLGGTTIHNSKSFIEMVNKMESRGLRPGQMPGASSSSIRQYN